MKIYVFDPENGTHETDFQVTHPLNGEDKTSHFISPAYGFTISSNGRAEIHIDHFNNLEELIDDEFVVNRDGENNIRVFRGQRLVGDGYDLPVYYSKSGVQIALNHYSYVQIERLYKEMCLARKHFHEGYK